MTTSFLLAGSFSPAYQRSLIVLSTAMLMFAAKILHNADLINLLKSSLELDVSTLYCLYGFVLTCHGFIICEQD